MLKDKAKCPFNLPTPKINPHFKSWRLNSLCLVVFYCGATFACSSLTGYTFLGKGSVFIFFLVTRKGIHTWGHFRLCWRSLNEYDSLRLRSSTLMTAQGAVCQLWSWCHLIFLLQVIFSSGSLFSLFCRMGDRWGWEIPGHWSYLTISETNAGRQSKSIYFSWMKCSHL